jgi:hypothetical protein
VDHGGCAMLYCRCRCSPRPPRHAAPRTGAPRPTCVAVSRPLSVPNRPVDAQLVPRSAFTSIVARDACAGPSRNDHASRRPPRSPEPPLPPPSPPPPSVRNGVEGIAT